MRYTSDLKQNISELLMFENTNVDSRSCFKNAAATENDVRNIFEKHENISHISGREALICRMASSLVNFMLACEDVSFDHQGMIDTYCVDYSYILDDHDDEYDDFIDEVADDDDVSIDTLNTVFMKIIEQFPNMNSCRPADLLRI